MKYDGFGVLLSAMQSNIEKLQIKAAFLLSALCSESNAVRGECLSKLLKSALVNIFLDLEHVLERKLIDHLAELLSKKDQPYEHLLAALLSLVRDHPQAQEECKRPELYFYNILIKLREHSIIHENLVRMFGLVGPYFFLLIQTIAFLGPKAALPRIADTPLQRNFLQLGRLGSEKKLF